MQELIIEVAGWIGMILILLAYFLLLALKKIDENSRIYNLMNLFGALLIFFNSFYHYAYPSAALNIVWSAVAIYGLIKGLRVFRR